MSAGLSRSMAVIASSTSLPMAGCRAWALRPLQRASGGTQKMFSARYSSGSSGSAPSSCSPSSRACISSKASEMYLRKISPRTTCLYSAASIEPRSASAMRQSSASWPVVAPWVSAGGFGGPDVGRDTAGRARRPPSFDVAASPTRRAARSVFFRPESSRLNARHSSFRRLRESSGSNSSSLAFLELASASTSCALTRRSSTCSS